MYASLEQEGPSQDHDRLVNIKGLFGHDAYHIGYVTSDETEQRAVSEDFPANKVLFVDREGEVGKFYTPVAKNQTFKDFRSTDTVGRLEHRNMPCCCDYCRAGQTCRHPHISGPWVSSTMQRVDITTPLAFTTVVTNKEGKEETTVRHAARVVFTEKGGAKVMGAEGDLKGVNAGSIVVVAQTDDDGGGVGVLRTGGTFLFYTLGADGFYHKPAEDTPQTQVGTQRYVVASQVGCKVLPTSIKLNEALAQLLSEEAELSAVATQYTGNNADDEATDDEEEEEQGSGGGKSRTRRGFGGGGGRGSIVVNVL